MISVLYIDPRGPYPKMGLDTWDETRDATRYDGPWPIVAHPDCGPWGCLRHLYKGHGHHCAPSAVEQVRRGGGVLEHPAHSRLWAHAGLPRPGDALDAWGGWTIEVCQVDVGDPVVTTLSLTTLADGRGGAVTRRDPGGLWVPAACVALWILAAVVAVVLGGCGLS